MRIILSLSLALAVTSSVACGSSEPQVVDTPPAAPVEAPAEVEPPAVEDEHTYYQVFWQEIHVLTIYRGRGSLRSEEAGHSSDVFSGSCSYMSAISHYFEHEAEVRQLIDQADSLEGFFAILDGDPDYDVREAELEGGY